MATRQSRLVLLTAIGALAIFGALKIKAPAIPMEGYGFATPRAHQLTGSPLPDFAMRELKPRQSTRRSAVVFEAESRTRSTFHGKVLVMNFWATWCDPCKAEEPVLSDLARKYTKRGVQFLSIVHNDAPGNVVQHLAAGADIPFPILIGGSNPINDHLKIRGIPQTFIVSADGIIRTWFRGPVEDVSLAAAIDSALTVD
jgi:thiol-disulfide isomerase/thioredoxin